MGCPFHDANQANSAIQDFPLPRVDPLVPPPKYFEMQKSEGLGQARLWDGQIAWLVTRYDDVRAVLSDNRFSADITRPGYPTISAAMKVARGSNRTFITMDAPKHTEHRRMLMGEFSIKNVEGWRPNIQVVVDRLLDKFLQGPNPGDLVSGFTLAVPALVISELLGVPYEDHDFFQEKALTLTSSTATLEEAVQANHELCEVYLAKLVAEKVKNPADDVLSRLIVNHMSKGTINQRDVVSLARLLLIAGHETTANTTSVGVLYLLQRPDLWEKLRKHPELVLNAIEEILRFLDVTHSGRRRVALEDVVVNGQTIRAGDPVVILSVSANRDDTHFDDPHEFKIERDARTQLSFGYGPHQCIGQTLARVEMHVMLTTLLKRTPNLRLAEKLEDIEYKDKSLMYGVNKLLVSW